MCCAAFFRFICSCNKQYGFHSYYISNKLDELQIYVQIKFDAGIFSTYMFSQNVVHGTIDTDILFSKEQYVHRVATLRNNIIFLN